MDKNYSIPMERGGRGTCFRYANFEPLFFFLFFNNLASLIAW